MVKYRLDFSKIFARELKNFSEVNKKLDIVDFKIRMDRWVVNNDIIIEEEYKYLKNSGYDGDILQKIFKSARYYFSKLDKKNEKKKRKKYSVKDKELLERIKTHVEIKNRDKPSVAYNNFYEENKNYLDNHIEMLKVEGYEKKDATSKIKKIYKNKFFQMNKNKL